MLHLQRILNKLLGEIDMIGCPFGHFPILRFIAPEASGYKAFIETHRELWQFLMVPTIVAINSTFNLCIYFPHLPSPYRV